MLVQHLFGIKAYEVLHLLVNEVVKDTNGQGCLVETRRSIIQPLFFVVAVSNLT